MSDGESQHGWNHCNIRIKVSRNCSILPYLHKFLVKQSIGVCISDNYLKNQVLL